MEGRGAAAPSRVLLSPFTVDFFLGGVLHEAG